MRKNILNVVKVSTFALLLPLLAHAEGFERGNGGNDVALDFVRAARISLPTMQRQIVAGDLKIDTFITENKMNELKSLIDNSKVFAVDHKLCESEIDTECPMEPGFVAKNYETSKKILVHSEKWNALSQTDRARIALHEYLGILGLEKGNYSISSQVVAFADDRDKLDDLNNFGCQINLINQGVDPKLALKQSDVLYTGFFGMGKYTMGGFGERKLITRSFGWEQLPISLELSEKFNYILAQGVLGDGYLRLKLTAQKIVTKKAKRWSKETIEEVEAEEVIMPETVLISGEIQKTRFIQLLQNDALDLKLIVTCSRY